MSTTQTEVTTSPAWQVTGDESWARRYTNGGTGIVAAMATGSFWAEYNTARMIPMEVGEAFTSAAQAMEAVDALALTEAA